MLAGASIAERQKSYSDVGGQVMIQSFRKRATDLSQRTNVIEGQRYREAKSWLWGNPSPVWVVESVGVARDGIEYAELFCATESSLRKKLSTTVLKDRQRFGHAELLAAKNS
jgi:hypothetical protein